MNSSSSLNNNKQQSRNDNKLSSTHERIQLKIQQQKQRMRSAPSSNQKMILTKKRSDEKSIVTFISNQYPFLEDVSNEISLLKTTQCGYLSTQKISIFTKLNHRNIISIRKIVKSHKKVEKVEHQGSMQLQHFSFYYEVVPFSLRKIANFPPQIPFCKDLESRNLAQQLKEIMDYLIKHSILHILKLDDVGLNQNGALKIYLPPHVIFNPMKRSPNNIKLVDISVDKIIGWWQTSLNSHKSTKESLAYLTKQNNKIFSMSESMKLQGKILRHSESLSCSLDASGVSNQQDRMDSIHNQIQFIKQKVHQQVKNRKDIEDKRNIEKTVEAIKPTIIVSLFDAESKQQSEEIEEGMQLHHLNEDVNLKEGDGRKEREMNYPQRQQIQQNIHCINIYNNHMNVMKKNDAELYRDSHDHLSVDTYDMDIEGDDLGMPKTKAHKSFRPNYIPSIEKEPSQISHAVQRHNTQDFAPLPNSNNKLNQVVNKNIHQSAGPMQLKNIFNNFIKPQFLSKKSNIYQDQGEYESSHSRSISKRKINQCIERQIPEIRHSGGSRTITAENSKKDYRRHLDKMKIESILQETEKYLAKNESNQKLKVYEQSKNIEHQGMNQKSQLIFSTKKQVRQKSSVKMAERVKKAMQKTKDAIALLKKVKQSKLAHHCRIIS